MPMVGHYHQSIIIKSFSEVFHSHCCGASEPQHNQDLKGIYKLGRILEFITFYQNALHLTRVHCANFLPECSRHFSLRHAFCIAPQTTQIKTHHSVP